MVLDVDCSVAFKIQMQQVANMKHQAGEYKGRRTQPLGAVRAVPLDGGAGDLLVALQT